MNIADYGFAIWETFYVTVLSTAFALVLGLPLGVLLVAGDKDGILPLPGWLMHLINIVINILRSVPFLILMICVFPLTRAIVGTTVGTKATILGYSAMSGVIGGGGLGKIALSYGYYRYQTNIMIVCVVLLVLMVQAFQSVGTLWATKSDKRLRK